MSAPPRLPGKSGPGLRTRVLSVGVIGAGRVGAPLGAARAHGANHLVTLVNEVPDRLRDTGVVNSERPLGPLLHAALENTLRLGDSALTDPVPRGDANTVARHLERLAEVARGSVAPYRALARRTAERALARRTAERAIAAGRLRATDA